MTPAEELDALLWEFHTGLPLYWWPGSWMDYWTERRTPRQPGEQGYSWWDH